MMNFDFGMTAGASQSTARKQLEGNNIYDVKFDGCEARDFAGVQDPTRSFKVLDIKFSNEDGYFTDTVWEPTEQDMQDSQGAFGPQPSNIKQMMLKFKHLIDAVNPDLAKKIDSGEQKLNAPSWDALRQFMVKATTPGIGTATKIKLIKSNKGEARFPYFANYNKAGQLYMSTNFIGDHIFWTNKELNKIKQANEAKPTTPTDPFSFTAPANKANTDSFDATFNDAGNKVDDDIDFNF